MPRMLGRYLTGGCGCGKRLKFRQPLGLDCCGHDSDPRRFKRTEAQQVEQEIAAGIAEYADAFTEMVTEKYRLDLITPIPRR